MSSTYVPRRPARSRFVALRGLDYHLLEWGEPENDRATLVLLHGWMDVAASFQFVVDALKQDRHVIAPDWRGFGQTRTSADSYWFPDYLADLDALLDTLPDAQRRVDIAGHSMGGNVAMVYAGVRPQRLHRLVNLEGFGMPETRPAQAPGRYRLWLDQLREPAALRSYASLADVAARLMKNNPRLAADRAAWLAPHWSEQRADGQWHILGDPAHKRANPVLYRKDEVVECWKRIEAPVLWIEGEQTNVDKMMGGRYPRDDFEERLSVVGDVQRQVLADCGHMLHHDQPEAVARRMEIFLNPGP